MSDDFISLGCPRLEYGKLMGSFTDIEELKSAIVKSVWNDDRLYRDDIKDIADKLLMELEFG